MTFAALPPATLNDAMKIVRIMLAQIDELADQAAMLAASIHTQKIYLEQALEGIDNEREERDA